MPGPVFQFDRFELDLARYELRRGGGKINLQRLPLDLLIFLAERPGVLVTREEIEARLWTSGAMIEADRSTNTAIRKVRQALGDDAGQPRFIETVVGKGYRFIAEVSRLPDVEPLAAPVSEGKSPGPTQRESNRRPRLARTAFSLFLAVCALATASAVLWYPRESHDPIRITPFTALPGEESEPAFSPDGNRIAFVWVAESGDQGKIYVKTVGSATAARLTDGPGRDFSPAWSPDGTSIAFVREVEQGASVYIVASAGGLERKIRELEPTGTPVRDDSRRLLWTPDGKSLAVRDTDSPTARAGIFIIALDTGAKRRLITPDPAGSGDWHPAFSPDGRTLAWVRNTGGSRATQLYAVRVNRDGSTLGQPWKIETNRSDISEFDWTADGHSLICSTALGLIRVAESGGAAEPLPFRDARQPAVSRQARRLAFVQSFRDTDIFRVAIDSGTIVKLISSTKSEGSPKYSPDGSHIVFVSDRTGSDELWVSDSEGKGQVPITNFGRASLGSPAWSPDGQYIAFDSTAEGSSQIYLVRMNGGVPRRIAARASVQVRPAWSRDGHWIYFGSNRSGDWEIWKADRDGGRLVQVTRHGGREAFEDPEGKFLYFTKSPPTAGIWRIPVAGGGAEQVNDVASQGQWTVSRRGIYYGNRGGELEFQEFSTGRRSRVPVPGLRIARGRPEIAADDRWLLITGITGSGSDLVLVDNFR